MDFGTLVSVRVSGSEYKPRVARSRGGECSRLTTDRIRELAKAIIEISDLVKFFPPGAWPDEHFGVMVVQRGLGDIVSDRYLVGTADARRVWIWKG